MTTEEIKKKIVALSKSLNIPVRELSEKIKVGFAYEKRVNSVNDLQGEALTNYYLGNVLVNMEQTGDVDIYEKYQKTQQELSKQQTPSQQTTNINIKEVVDHLMEINDEVFEEQQFQSGGEIYQSTKQQIIYINGVDKKISESSKIPTSLPTEVFEMLEGENYHLMNNYLALKGYFGEEQQAYYVEMFNKYPSNFLNPDNLSIVVPYIPKEIKTYTMDELLYQPFRLSWEFANNTINATAKYDEKNFYFVIDIDNGKKGNRMYAKDVLEKLNSGAYKFEGYVGEVKETPIDEQLVSIDTPAQEVLVQQELLQKTQENLQKKQDIATQSQGEAPLPDNYYKINDEGKLEMYFDYAYYKSLSDTNKQEIKSAFLWSNRNKAWVSRSKNNTYRAEEIAKKLLLVFVGREERISFKEQLERKEGRAESRAERYEKYAENATERAARLRSEYDRLRKDWAWVTQPNITDSSRGRAFTKSRDRVMNNVRKSWEETDKAGYFANKADLARDVINKPELKNPRYLENRIKENRAEINKTNRNIDQIQTAIDTKKDVYGRDISDERIAKLQAWIEQITPTLRRAYEKLAYYSAAYEDLLAVSNETVDLEELAATKEAQIDEIKKREEERNALHAEQFNEMVISKGLDIKQKLSDVMPDTTRELVVGQRVTYKKHRGLIILGFETPDQYGNCVYISTDSYWVSHKPNELTPEKEAPKTEVIADIKIFTPEICTDIAKKFKQYLIKTYGVTVKVKKSFGTTFYVSTGTNTSSVKLPDTFFSDISKISVQLRKRVTLYTIGTGGDIPVEVMYEYLKQKTNYIYVKSL